MSAAQVVIGGLLAVAGIIAFYLAYTHDPR